MVPITHIRQLRILPFQFQQSEVPSGLKDTHIHGAHKLMQAHRHILIINKTHLKRSIFAFQRRMKGPALKSLGKRMTNSRQAWPKVRLFQRQKKSNPKKIV